LNRRFNVSAEGKRSKAEINRILIVQIPYKPHKEKPPVGAHSPSASSSFSEKKLKMKNVIEMKLRKKKLYYKQKTAERMYRR